MNRSLLLFHRPVQQKLLQKENRWSLQYATERHDRVALMEQLLEGAAGGELHAIDSQKARALLDPWFGFSVTIEPEDMRSLLKGS